MMTEIYFKRPVIWDYSIGIIFSLFTIFLFARSILILPKEEYILSVASDLSMVALTLSGFILTLLTVFITFKSGSKITKNTNNEKATLFELFFATDLYFQTVKHFKNCVKSLIFIAVFGYSLKIALNENNYCYIYFYNVFSLIIIVLTLWRSLLILSKIIKMQNNN
jgi:hypothetical protein